MKTTTKRPGGWSAIRPPLTTWEKPALITLIKELYDAAAAKRGPCIRSSRNGWRR